MQIGNKHDYDGAFYSIPEANNKFARKDDIVNVENVVSNLKEQTELLADSVSGVTDAVRELDEMIPTPTADDNGKVLTANEQGGYDVEEIPQPDISGKMDKVNPTGSGTISIGRIGEPIEGSIAMGVACQASKTNSIAFGSVLTATGNPSLAVGYSVKARAQRAICVGSNVDSASINTVLIGNSLNASTNPYSVVIGNNLSIGGNDSQVIIGNYNNYDYTKYFIMGNGTPNSKSNIFTIDRNGNAEFLGSVNGIPHAPTTDGTYNLQVTVTNGEPAYSWVAV